MNNNFQRDKILIEEVKNIQDIIKRMASNSFNIKTWTVTLVVATLLFKGSQNMIFIAFIPLICFWYLDAYYLRQERLFRKFYNHIIKYRINHDDKIFEINPVPFNKEVQTIYRIMASISILPFYGGIFIMLLLYLNIDFILELLK